jgi:LysR family hca operon transcriptional activator
MEHRHLRYFIAVAEELNFTRAAERLHTVQPSLSQQIRQLEEMVGAPLFFREKRHLRLTEAGRVFLEQAREVLQTTDRAVKLARKAARGQAGYIAIGFVGGAETRVFVHILPVLLEKYPDIHLALRSLSEPALVASLQDHTTDVAFMTGPIQDPELASEVILRQKIVVVVPATHPLAKLRRIPVARLGELRLVRPSPANVPALSSLIELLAEQSGVRFQLIYVDDFLATLNVVGAGVGFSIMPEFVKEVLPRSVAVRPLDLRPEPVFELLAVYRRDDRIPALGFFLNLLRERMREEH